MNEILQMIFYVEKVHRHLDPNKSYLNTPDDVIAQYFYGMNLLSYSVAAYKCETPEQNYNKNKIGNKKKNFF